MGKRFSAVILAAGESARFGRDKLSLRLGSKSVIEHAIGNFLMDPIEEIIVVTGKYRPATFPYPDTSPVRWVNNPNYASGMGSSVKVGIGQLHSKPRAVFVTPADIPLIQPDTIQKMISVFDDGRIVIPTYRGKKGHPVLLGYDVALQCLTARKEKVLYEVIADNSHAVTLLTVEDEGILLDIDNKEDFEALEKYYTQHLIH